MNRFNKIVSLIFITCLFFASGAICAQNIISKEDLNNLVTCAKIVKLNDKVNAFALLSGNYANIQNVTSANLELTFAYIDLDTNIGNINANNVLTKNQLENPKKSGVYVSKFTININNSRNLNNIIKSKMRGGIAVFSMMVNYNKQIYCVPRIKPDSTTILIRAINQTLEVDSIDNSTNNLTGNSGDSSNTHLLKPISDVGQ